MTNLMRWLMYLGLFLIPYTSICLGFVETNFTNEHFLEIQLLPIAIVGLFGLYAVCTVISDVLSVKDCPEAAKELNEQIEEARKDLISKGFKFRD